MHHDIYVIDAQKGVVDQNGKTKTVLKGLLLSKERECYKGTDKQQETGQIQYYQQQYQDTFKEQITESNLPVKQNRFLRFFSQIRSRFSRQGQNQSAQKRGPFRRKNENIEQYESEYKEQQGETRQQQSKEKKSWELEPEEKTRIQKETAEIAKRHREQTEQQKHSQTLQQGNNQQETNYEYSTNQTAQQGQVPPQQQSPIMEMGGMEL